jgi:Holliday junction resolvase RusA-like endonuclease
MTPIHLVLPGPARTKKNSATLQMRGRRRVLVPSDAWMAWRDRCRAWWLQSFTVSRRPVAPPDVPLNCRALIYRDAHRGDAVGYYQGVADVLEELGVVENDEQLVAWDGSRLLLDRDRPRVELTITPL